MQKTEAAIQNYSLKQVFLIGIVFQKYLSRKSVFSKVRRQVYVTKNEILNKHFPRTLFKLRVTFLHVSHDFQKKRQAVQFPIRQIRPNWLWHFNVGKTNAINRLLLCTKEKISEVMAINICVMFHSVKPTWDISLRW